VFRQDLKLPRRTGDAAKDYDALIAAIEAWARGLYPPQGNWTPIIAGDATAGTQTYSTQIGKYTLIGRTVLVEGLVIMSAKDGTTAGNIVITGLPFTSINSGQTIGAIAVSAVQNIALTAGYSQFGLAVKPGDTKLSLLQAGNNVAAATIAAAAINATSAIAFGGTYSI
jgi:hypothetical protein